MTNPVHRIAALALLLAAAAAPALADSSTSSLVSDSASTSVGASSASIGRSSNSSSKDREVAEGRYRVIEMAEAPARPGHLRLKLQPEDPAARGGEFFLTLPRQAAELARIEPGQVITARPRAYGVAFAHSETMQDFFLVLADDWARQLKTRVVRL